jgi:hypothetical protein
MTTETLLPFTIEAFKADPMRVRLVGSGRPVLAMLWGEGVAVQWTDAMSIVLYGPPAFTLLRLYNRQRREAMSDEQRQELLTLAGNYASVLDRCGQSIVDARKRKLVAYVDSLIAAEREACAEMCESTYPEVADSAQRPMRTIQLACFDTPAECAAAIRART